MASIQHRPGRAKPWRVHYRDPLGADRSHSFVRKGDARAFANAVETDMRPGQYLDPEAGKVRFAEFGGQWAASLTVDAKTAEGIASRLRAHLLPAFGDCELRHVKPSTDPGLARRARAPTSPATSGCCSAPCPRSSAPPSRTA